MVVVAPAPGATESPAKLHTPWRTIVVSVRVGPAIVGALSTVWAVGFAYLAVTRDLAGGSHAEDLGFTDQVLWNFIHRGQWFRMSIYSGATWNTEIDISHLARPDSLLAFHFEPMLLGLLPIYALGLGATALLVLQAAAVAAGAVPAFRLARHLTGSDLCGLAVATAYLLSPFGQWAVLADFHTSTLAAPLLLLCAERLIVARVPWQAFIAAALATTAREDVAPVVAVFGLAILLNPDTRRWGIVVATFGVAWTILSLTVIRSYSGDISPFQVRYAAVFADPLGTLARPIVSSYVATLLLSGGWAGIFAPMALAPALPSLALNALSSSPWMASGKAHYSGLVLPFVTLGAAHGLARFRAHPRLLAGGACALVLTSVVSYAVAGAGPLGTNYAPAEITPHAERAAAIASSLPADAAISASANLVPRVSERARVYEFPAVLDADYVFVDLLASPAPTSAGDVYLRVQTLLASGWQALRQDDGLLLLGRGQSTEPSPPSQVASNPSITATPSLVSAELVPGPDGAVDVDGPRWILHTTWQTDQPLPVGTRPDFWIDLRDGEHIHAWDIAEVWWNPPDQWPVGQPVAIDIRDVPVSLFSSWSVTWSTAP